MEGIHVHKYGAHIFHTSNRKVWDFVNSLAAVSYTHLFDMYLLMTVLSLAHLRLPAFVVSFSGIVGQANAFLAMLMIGVGFRLSGDRSQMGQIVKILTIRYAVSAALAAAFYLDVYKRQGLCTWGGTSGGSALQPCA